MSGYGQQALLLALRFAHRAMPRANRAWRPLVPKGVLRRVLGSENMPPLMTLKEQLERLSPATQRRIGRRGFDPERLMRWASEMHLGQEARNVLRGEVLAFDVARMAEVPPSDSEEHARLSRIGSEAIARGELAVCVLAGGMATRMGGVVKALVELAPGFTFLDVALFEREHLRKIHGRAPALWLMTSEPTNGPIRAALGERRVPLDVHTFEQFVSLRLTEDGELFFDTEGEPSVYATGHGDLPDALRASGLLELFIERGGRYVWIANLDNLGARVDAALLGQHIESAAPLSVEVVDKYPGDKGGGPVTLDGEPIIAEHFRLPSTFDVDSVPVFNTNTFLVDAARLRDLELDWTYLEVRKTVKEGDRERVAVQFERLLGEITMTIPPRIQRVPRDGARSRFLGMKTRDDIEEAHEAIQRLVASLRQD